MKGECQKLEPSLNTGFQCVQFLSGIILIIILFCLDAQRKGIDFQNQDYEVICDIGLKSQFQLFNMDIEKARGYFDHPGKSSGGWFCRTVAVRM
jgi:hypothetical protein